MWVFGDTFTLEVKVWQVCSIAFSELTQNQGYMDISAKLNPYTFSNA